MKVSITIDFLVKVYFQLHSLYLHYLSTTSPSYTRTIPSLENSQ
jgi:hypothetical protein